jgi:hypothetical protein
MAIPWSRRFSISCNGRRAPAREGTTAQTWTVFDSAGVWLGELTLPAQFDVKVVARGREYGVLEDSFGVESVQVYRLHRDLR